MAGGVNKGRGLAMSSENKSKLFGGIVRSMGLTARLVEKFGAGADLRMDPSKRSVFKNGLTGDD